MHTTLSAWRVVGLVLGRRRRRFGGQPEAVPPASGTAAPATATAATAPADDDAPLPPTASPFDALPEGVRSVIDQPFTGDFDAVGQAALESAVGVTFDRTHYFIDKGQERGLTFEALKQFDK